MLDLLATLGWQYVLRVQGQTHVLQADGTESAIRTLVRRVGDRWVSEGAMDDTAPAPVVAAFKKVGWRACRVVAVWAAGQPEPWLLLTNRAGRLAEAVEYASRWAIERLFLCWKSPGWNIEASGVHAPLRLARLLTGLALAILWRLLLALPSVFAELDDLAGGQPFGRDGRRSWRSRGLP